MFIGHYGVALASKRVSPRLSLGVLFLAVQLLDVLFSLFVLAGIEKLRIVDRFTAYNPYDLYGMPYSHSLLGAAAWSVLAALAWWASRRHLPSRERRTEAAVLGRPSSPTSCSTCPCTRPICRSDSARAPRRSAWGSGTTGWPRSARSSRSSSPEG